MPAPIASAPLGFEQSYSLMYVELMRLSSTIENPNYLMSYVEDERSNNRDRLIYFVFGTGTMEQHRLLLHNTFDKVLAMEDFQLWLREMACFDLPSLRALE